jgi:hypothetical protein
MSNATPRIEINASDFPALFWISGRAAMRSQKTYLWLVRINLAAMILCAASTSVSVAVRDIRVACAILGTCAIAIALIVTVLTKVLECDRVWFGARAVAESTKTIAWRYMANAAPYSASLSPQEVDDLFTREVGSIVHGRAWLSCAIGGVEAAGPQITNKMREVRAQSLDVRKQLYIEYRIKDQQRWYARESQRNRRATMVWWTVIGICQAIAIIAGMLLVRWPDFNVNFASILSSLATVFLAWLQVKRHQELSHAYGMATHELSLIIEKAAYVKTDEDLSRFVMDSENAISREHTAWVARRDSV